MKKIVNKNLNWFIAIVILISIFFVFLAIKDFSYKKGLPQKSDLGNGAVDLIYKNKEYGFEITYPNDWKIYEDDSEYPIINIYKPKFNSRPPYDQFSEITQISIFPEGVPTEAVIGDTKNSEIKLQYEFDKSIDYVLSDGNVWASFLSFKNPPKNWKAWGFVWLSQEISDLKYECIKEGKKVEINICNPFGGDIFVRLGKVDSEIRQEQLKILNSIKFVD